LLAAWQGVASLSFLHAKTDGPSSTAKKAMGDHMLPASMHDCMRDAARSDHTAPPGDHTAPPKHGIVLCTLQGWLEDLQSGGTHLSHQVLDLLHACLHVSLSAAIANYGDVLLADRHLRGGSMKR